MGLDNKTIQAKYKERMRLAGFRLLALWVHVDDIEKVKALVLKLKDKRSK